MKKYNFNYLLFSLLLLMSVTNYSQHSDVDHIYLNAKSLTSIDLTSKELVGNSYIEERFLPSDISNQETSYLIRYNAYRDEMEIELDGKPYYLPLTSYYSITFNLSNKTYQVLDFKEKKTTKKGFFVVMYLGTELSLFLKEKIKLYEEVPPKAGFSQYEPPKLGRVKDKLFIGYKDNTAIELPNKKKEIIKLFLHKSGEVQSYVKENKLRFKNKQDLIQILKYYNSLK